jgi:hypothetical protein
MEHQSPSGRNWLMGAKMVAECGSHDWRDRKVRDWQLLLLRFAVTREASDRSAALAAADELDSLGMRWRPAAPRFFLRTSDEVCEAISAESDKRDGAVLLRHVARISDPRLRRTFRAALGLQQTSELQPQKRKGKRPNDQCLWEGLKEN